MRLGNRPGSLETAIVLPAIGRLDARATEPPLSDPNATRNEPALGSTPLAIRFRQLWRNASPAVVPHHMIRPDRPVHILIEPGVFGDPSPSRAPACLQDIGQPTPGR